MGAAAIFAGAGLGMQIIGGVSSGQASKREAYRQARLARQEGREAKRLADYETRLIYEAGAETRGQIAAETGKSGLAMSGSALEHMVRTARQVELTAALKQREGDVTQERYANQSAVGIQAGKDAYTASILGGLASAAQFAGFMYAARTPSTTAQATFAKY